MTGIGNNLTPKISVIMPVYNCEDFVAEAIDSILNQTFSDFELIIIDDKSTDTTVEIINTYDDPRINFIEKPANSGYTSSLILGSDIARGEFIARMDGDDISYIDRLEKQFNYLMLNPEIVLCGTWFELTSTKEAIKHPIDHEDIKIAFLNYCAVGHPTVMFRRSFFIKNELQYNTEFEPAEDFDLWTRLVSFGEIANIPEILLQYRVHDNQISNKKLLIQKQNADRCIRRMICKPLDNITEKDIVLSEALFETEKIQNTNALHQIINWLDHLVDLNKKKTFYKEFEFNQFISGKKKNLIRPFFLYCPSYNPGILFSFILLNNKNKQYLFLTEQLKLIIKCMIFWKIKNKCCL